MDTTIIRKRLKKARETAEITQEQMVSAGQRISGPQLRAIQNAESGQTKDPKASTLILWSLVTGASVDWLLGLSDDNGPTRRGLGLSEVDEAVAAGYAFSQRLLASLDAEPGTPGKGQKRD